jgi:hypothetical protein
LTVEGQLQQEIDDLRDALRNGGSLSPLHSRMPPPQDAYYDRHLYSPSGPSAMYNATAAGGMTGRYTPTPPATNAFSGEPAAMFF